MNYEYTRECVYKKSCFYCIYTHVPQLEYTFISFYIRTYPPYPFSSNQIDYWRTIILSSSPSHTFVSVIFTAQPITQLATPVATPSATNPATHS